QHAAEHGGDRLGVATLVAVELAVGAREHVLRHVRPVRVVEGRAGRELDGVDVDRLRVVERDLDALADDLLAGADLVGPEIVRVIAPIAAGPEPGDEDREQWQRQASHGVRDNTAAAWAGLLECHTSMTAPGWTRMSRAANRGTKSR